MAMDGPAIGATAESRLDGLDLDRLVFGETFTDHMLSMAFEAGAWGPPELLPYGPIPMEPGIMSLHYGQMVFEGLKAYRGDDGLIRLFRPDRNAGRLRDSCRRMCIPELPEPAFVDAVERLVGADHAWVPDRPGYSLYVRPLLFGMEPSLQVRPAKRYRFIVMASPTGPYFRSDGDGLSLLVETACARTAPEGGVGQRGQAPLGTLGARTRGKAGVLRFDGWLGHLLGPRQHPAIYGQGGSGDKGRLVRGEEQHGIGDVLASA